MTKKSKLKPGQAIMCELVEREPGGYKGRILSYDIEAFVPSRDELELGSQVPTTFVCMSNNRALVTFAYVVGTSERVQMGLPNADETAFTIWADSYPSNVSLRRAVDVIMPSLTGKLIHSVKAKEINILDLVEDIESRKITGCIKCSSDEALSRGASLLLDGRAIGCIYGNKKQQEAYLFDKALINMFNDMNYEDATILVYELPSEIVYSMASLFIGCPIRKKSQSRNASVMDEILPDLESSDETACFTLTANEIKSQSLGFLYKGKRHGSYSVVEQVYEENYDQLFNLSKTDSELESHVYLLPKEMISDSVLLGYSLPTICKQVESQ